MVDPGAQPDVKFGEWEKVCVDFASFPALAADHSCSADELWADVSREPWAVKVVWVAARTKERLATSTSPAQHEDVWSLSHLAMQYVDPRYLTRAEGNNAHFLVPRAPVLAKEDLNGYLDRVLLPTTEINATGLYAEYHMLACGSPPSTTPRRRRRRPTWRGARSWRRAWRSTSWRTPSPRATTRRPGAARPGRRGPTTTTPPSASPR